MTRSDAIVYAVARPYHLLAGKGQHTSFVALLTSEEAQRLLDNATARNGIRSVSDQRVVYGDGGALYTLAPATLGGGPAFTVPTRHDPYRRDETTIPANISPAEAEALYEQRDRDTDRERDND